MQVKSFTYKKMLSDYYLQSMFSSQKMDEHMAEMLTNGWKVVSTTSQAGDGRTFGPGVKRDTITTIFQKD